MNNWVKKIKVKSKKKSAKLYPEEGVYVKKYTSFNIFTKNGENTEVKSPRPMTLGEAMNHFGALAIGANY